MRRSPLRHTLAVLRGIIGYRQKEFAELVGKSTPAIQAIELGKLPLSDKLAERISYETGIFLGWLLDDDVTRSPISRHGEPYTREFFQSYRSVLAANGGYDEPEEADIRIRFLLACEIGEIMATAISAKKSGQMALFSYMTSRALRQLATEFGGEESARFSGAATPYFDPAQHFDIGIGKMLERFFAEWEKTPAPVKRGRGSKAAS